MLVFGNDKNTRGCFVALRLNTAEARGAQLRMPDGTLLPENEYSFPLTVTGFEFGQVENASFVKCFGDYVYTYAFGHDPQGSALQVTFAGMLRKGTSRDLFAKGGGGGSSREILDVFPERYNANRLYNSLKYAKFWMGGTDVLKGFIVAMNSSTLDPQVSLQNFTVTLQLVEAQGSK